MVDKCLPWKRQPYLLLVHSLRPLPFSFPLNGNSSMDLFRNDSISQFSSVMLSLCSSFIGYNEKAKAIETWKRAEWWSFFFFFACAVCPWPWLVHQMVYPYFSLEFEYLNIDLCSFKSIFSCFFDDISWMAGSGFQR